MCACVCVRLCVSSAVDVIHPMIKSSCYCSRNNEVRAGASMCACMCVYVYNIMCMCVCVCVSSVDAIHPMIKVPATVVKSQSNYHPQIHQDT